MRPLEGVKVVELAAFVAAPAAGRLLGEWGAEVIKVEGPGGDGNRTTGLLNKMPIDDDENPSFDTTSFNKKFVCVDTKKPEGKLVLFKLLEDADVFLTNFRVDALARLGLTYEEISARLPRIIFAHLLGFGEEGPEKNTAGFDYTAYVARGGLLGTVYQKGGEPINSITSYGDFQASVCLTAGICGALLGRQKSGKGDKVTVSLHGTAMYMLNWGIMGAAFGSSYPKSRKDVNCPTINTYKSSDDRWLQLCGADYNRYFAATMKTIGREDLLDHPRYQDLVTIQETGETKDVICIIEEEIKKRPVDEWLARFKANDIPCEKAYTFEEILEDEQAWASKALVRVPYPTGNENTFVASPVKMQSMGEPTYEISRRIGYHTNEVLQQYGYSQGEIDVLVEAGVLKN